MQKLVIDTNVFISALIQRSYPYLIVTEIFSNRKLQLCISDAVFEEYADVLRREKFSRFPDFVVKAQLLLTKIEKKAVRYLPEKKVAIIKDAADNKFLELSDSSNAEFLITGNTTDFSMRAYKGTRIVTPKEFWEEHLLR